MDSLITSPFTRTSQRLNAHTRNCISLGGCPSITNSRRNSVLNSAAHFPAPSAGVGYMIQLAPARPGSSGSVEWCSALRQPTPRNAHKATNPTKAFVLTTHGEIQNRRGLREKNRQIQPGTSKPNFDAYASKFGNVL